MTDTGVETWETQKVKKWSMRHNQCLPDFFSCPCSSNPSPLSRQSYLIMNLCWHFSRTKLINPCNSIYQCWKCIPGLQGFHLLYTGMSIWEFPWMIHLSVCPSDMEFGVEDLSHCLKKVPAWETCQLGVSHIWEGVLIVSSSQAGIVEV